MKVGHIETLKLTQRGDHLDGTFSCTRNFISRRADTSYDTVIKADKNDLNKLSVSPQSLIGKLNEHVNYIKSFSNVSKIFFCEEPSRKHRVNSKINHFNNLLVDELSNADNIILAETIPLEARLFHTDNLHLNGEGLKQISGIILSVLYKVIAPDLYRTKPEEADQSKQGNLSFSHITACSPIDSAMAVLRDHSS